MSNKKQDYPPQMKKFIETFKDRFNEQGQTCCDYHECRSMLLANQVQIFTMPDLKVKVFCHEHLLATLFRYDKLAFEKIVKDNYEGKQVNETKNYFESMYGHLF